MNLTSMPGFRVKMALRCMVQAVNAVPAVDLDEPLIVAAQLLYEMRDGITRDVTVKAYKVISDLDNEASRLIVVDLLSGSECETSLAAGLRSQRRAALKKLCEAELHLREGFNIKEAA